MRGVPLLLPSSSSAQTRGGESSQARELLICSRGVDWGSRRRRGRKQNALAEREAIDRAAEDREVMYVCGDADDEAGGATTKEMDVDLASSFPGGWVIGGLGGATIYYFTTTNAKTS